jgi:ribosomal protein L11 methyltransferase
MTDQWWEIEVLGLGDNEDLVFWELQLSGCIGTASFEREGKPVTCGYLPASQFLEDDVEAIAQHIKSAIAQANLPDTEIRWATVLQEDWANSWKDYWKTEAIGNQFLIHPDWLPDPELGDRRMIRLDPGVAFGTGAHPTTQLCLEALERYLPTAESAQGQVIVDIGCGSGILSIAALKLGAAQTFSVDTDPLAVDSTKASRTLNQIPAENLKVFEGSVNTLIEQKIKPVNGICCNILAEIILRLIPEITQLTQAGTWAIFSGILERQAESVIEALKSQGWTLGVITVKGDWCSIEAMRQSP